MIYYFTNYTFVTNLGYINCYFNSVFQNNIIVKIVKVYLSETQYLFKYKNNTTMENPSPYTRSYYYTKRVGNTSSLLGCSAVYEYFKSGQFSFP